MLIKECYQFNRWVILKQNSIIQLLFCIFGEIKQKKMERIYHPYWLWEDYRCGFYENIGGKDKKILSDKVLEMFRDEKLTREFMLKVVNEWKYSCEHNLTNPSVNKIAYIGQSACCIYAGIPNSITMEMWSKLTKSQQEKANEIAKEVIDMWIENNKNIQLCLNLD